ncbi:MAG: hypothetical protein R3B81_03170 [bacterium]
MNERNRVQVLEYLAGTLSEEERADFERRLLADDELADELYAEGALDDAFRRAREVTGGAPSKVVPLATRRLSPWLIALPLAAAIALVAIPMARRDSPAPAESTMRGSSGIQVTEPVGDVTTLGRFAWTGFPGAVSYEIVIRDATGRDLWTGHTTTTSIVPPPDALPPSLVGGSWTVRAVDSHGFEIEKGLATFRVVP